MNIYTTDKIRNVVLLGHGGSGKTSLVEAMAYLSGITSRLGKVDDGNTVSDFGKEEQKRKISVSTSVIPIEWAGNKINIIDTPGFFDFAGEVEEGISAAGAAIIVVNGKAGVEVGTKKAWDLCEKYKLPRMIYVSNMDVDNASFRQVVEDMTAMFGKKMAPFHLLSVRMRNLSATSMSLQRQVTAGRVRRLQNARCRITISQIFRSAEIP